MASISFFGLGYVGLVCAACQASEGHRVTGVDINETKLSLIRNGKAPIAEKGLEEKLQKAISLGNLNVTSSASEGVLNSDVIFVCVGTPSTNNGGLDLTYIKRVASEIGKHLASANHKPTIVIRSTVLPGTTNDVVKSIIEAESGKKAGKDFNLAANPEFLREGSAIEDYYNPPMTVIGCDDDISSEPLTRLYQNLPCELICLDIKTSELVKYSCNAWHATKVAFANEIGRLSKSMGIDGRQVMDTLCKDKALNLSSYYMRPAFAFGGSCLPKDVRALDHEARHRDLQLPLIHAVLESNRKHIYRVLSQIAKLKKNKIGLLGLTFKSGTDDMRESPLIELASLLTSKGYDVLIYDPNLVDYDKVSDEIKPHIPYPYLLRLLSTDINDVVEFADVVVVGNNENEFAEIVSSISDDKTLIDLVGFMDSVSTANKQGVCW